MHPVTTQSYVRNVLARDNDKKELRSRDNEVEIVCIHFGE